MHKRPTLRSIAELAGVSHMTVSLALRNDPAISKDTRDRIVAIANQAGYRPDPMVAKVMSGLRFSKDSGHVIAYVTRYGEIPWKVHHVYGAVYAGACERAAEFGYKVETFALGDGGLTTKRLSQILHSRSISGVIVGGVYRGRGHISLDVSKLSSVMYGYSILRPNLHRVSNHNIHTALLALRKLRHFGNKRIGLIVEAAVDEMCEYSWSAALHIFQNKIPKTEHVPPFIQDELDYEPFKKWMLKNRVDAVCGIFYGATDYIKKMGLHIPGDVQVASLDIRPDRPEIAGVNQRHADTGGAMVDMLLGQIYANDVGIPKIPRTILIEGYWVNGLSAVSRHRTAK